MVEGVQNIGRDRYTVGPAMDTNDPKTIIHDVIEAHGGATLWHGIESIDATISAWGFLFTAKRRPVLDRVRMRAYVKDVRFTFFDYPKEGQKSELAGSDEVRIVARDDTITAVRKDPRSHFHGLRRFFKWDDLDFIYFAGYATWNYLTTPFLFLREGFILEVLKEALLPGGISMMVGFPGTVPSHCKMQKIHFDADLLLRRLDYTAEVVGRWARAAHICDDYRVFDGLSIPTRRRVYPLIYGTKPSRLPLLVAIDVHDIGLARQ